MSPLRVKDILPKKSIEKLPSDAQEYIKEEYTDKWKQLLQDDEKYSALPEKAKAHIHSILKSIAHTTYTFARDSITTNAQGNKIPRRAKKAPLMIALKNLSNDAFNTLKEERKKKGYSEEAAKSYATEHTTSAKELHANFLKKRLQRAFRLVSTDGIPLMHKGNMIRIPVFCIMYQH